MSDMKLKLKPPSLPPLTKSEDGGLSPKSSPRKPERVVLSEAQRVAELEAHIRKTAEEMIEKLQIEHAQSESRGVRKEVIYLEYMSSVPEHKAYLNPQATILVKAEGVTRLYEPESDLKRLQRDVGWQLITQSISDMPPANWKSVPLGNVHGLYTLITSHYRENDRKSVVKELNERLTGLAKSRSELFVTFHGRYQQLVLEMEKVGMNVDDDMMYTHVERALKMSGDEKLLKIYDSVLLISGKPETAEALFEKLLPAMKRHENDARTKHDLNDARTNRDLNDETERERKKKKEEKARTLRTRADDSTVLSNSDIIGTCLEFSETGKCPRINCSFKHQKLNDSQIKRLKELMKMKRERVGDWSDRSSITCYACGEKGHISTHCP
ncbi:MAG: C2HC-type zinc finger protein, partial [bacterium]